MSQPDGLRLYIHSSGERCEAKGLHRSGNKVRQISIGDKLYGSDDTACGKVLSVVTEWIDRDREGALSNWLYRVCYEPLPTTAHPIGGYVLWHAEATEKPQVIMPAAIAERSALPPAAQQEQTKRTKKAKVTGQRDNGDLAKSLLPTA